jgi:hypothetical protein
MKNEKTKTGNNSNHSNGSITPQEKLRIANMIQILQMWYDNIEFVDFQEICLDINDLEINKEKIIKWWNWYRCELEKIEYNDKHNIIPISEIKDKEYLQIAGQPYGDIKLLEYAICNLKAEIHPDDEIEDDLYYQSIGNIKEVGPFLGEVYVCYNNSDIVVFN